MYAGRVLEYLNEHGHPIQIDYRPTVCLQASLLGQRRTGQFSQKRMAAKVTP
jgi:hypothetical protein